VRATMREEQFMRAMKLVVVMAIVVMGLTAVSLGEKNKFGISDVQKLTLNKQIRVGEVLLPKGQYKVEHTMQGEEHIMVFTQMDKTKPVVAKVKCQLVPLPKKADQTQLVYQTSANEYLLQELVFRGDTAKHVF